MDDDEDARDDDEQDEGDDEETDVALHCVENGWHPALEVVLQRLDLLTSSDRSAYAQLLIEVIGARQDDDHLVGAIDQAIAALRALEVEALRALYALGDSTLR
jgi:hypothetical protein